MNIEWWMIDGIIGLVVLVAALRGAVKGIGDTVIRILGIVGGLALATMFSDKLSGYLMTTKLRTLLHDHIFVILSGTEEASEGADATQAVNAAGDDSMFAVFHGQDAEYLDSLPKSLGSIFDSAADKAADAAADRLAEIATAIIAFAVIVLLVGLIAGALRMLIRKGRKRSVVLGFTDRVLGMVLGVVRGLMIAWIGVAVLMPATALFSPENVAPMMEALQQTTVAKVMYDVNPFLMLIRYVLNTI